MGMSVVFSPVNGLYIQGDGARVCDIRRAFWQCGLSP